jgi:putative DNA primase/helicase
MISSSLHEIAHALGGEVAGGQVLAPGPGHSPSDRSLSVRLSATAPDGFLAFSHAGDGFAGSRDYIKGRLGLDPNAWKATSESRPRLRPQTIVKPDYDAELKRARASAARIASELVPISGTPGEAYLRDVRRIDVAAIADVLARTDAIGWHASVYFNQPDHPLHEQRLGAIVGIMTDPLTARPTGAINRTYIHKGSKVGKAKTLGRPVGVVRLSADEDVVEGLHLAEGIETALSAMSLDLRPMWSTGSSGLLAAFPTLNGIGALNVVVDHDASGAGERSARECERRWLGAGREVTLLMSSTPGDLNDALRVATP